MSRILPKLIPLLIVLAIAGLGAAGYFYYQNQQTQKALEAIKADPSTLKKAAEAEVKKLIDEVSSLIALPKDEQPTVATITDIEKLKQQPFFKNAKNGDKVLIYPNAKKAIIYDPNTRKIVDVAPINIGTSSAQQAAQQARVVLRNGTTTSGLTATVEAEIKKTYPEANISSKDNSTKTDYEKTIVVILNTSAKEAADRLAKSLNAQIVNLPNGEQKPNNADLLVIIGQDKVS